MKVRERELCRSLQQVKAAWGVAEQAAHCHGVSDAGSAVFPIRAFLDVESLHARLTVECYRIRNETMLMLAGFCVCSLPGVCLVFTSCFALLIILFSRDQ